jgi:hypothetical protein
MKQSGSNKRNKDAKKRSSVDAKRKNDTNNKMRVKRMLSNSCKNVWMYPIVWPRP